MTVTGSSNTAKKPHWVRRMGGLAAALLFLVYAGASHWAIEAHEPLWSVVPLLLSIGLVMALNARSYSVAVIVFMAIFVGVLLRWHPLWVVYLPPTILELLISYAFARTLVEGRQPLVEQYIRVVHTDPPAWLVKHARRLTWVWALVLAVLGVMAAALGLSGHEVAWSFFTTVISYALFAALFVLDYLYRLAAFPPEYHTSPVEIVRIVLRSRPLQRQPRGTQPPR